VVYHLPATCIALLVAVYTTLISKDANTWWDSAISSSSSSSSSSSQQQGKQDPKLQPRWEKAAWELACSRHDALPPSHYLLLQQQVAAAGLCCGQQQNTQNCRGRPHKSC
jgi:hypothetical protein